MHSTYGCAVVSIKPRLDGWSSTRPLCPLGSQPTSLVGARDHPTFRPADYKFRASPKLTEFRKCCTFDYCFIIVKGYTLKVKADKGRLHGRESGVPRRRALGVLSGPEGQSCLLLVGTCGPPTFYCVLNVFKMFIKSIPIGKWRIYHHSQNVYHVILFVGFSLLTNTGRMYMKTQALKSSRM